MKSLSWIAGLALLSGFALSGSARSGSVLSGSAATQPTRVPLEDEKPVEVSIMELTQIEWLPGKKLPARITALDGKRVKIKGFMALDTEEGTDEFRLTYDQCGCSNAKASHFVQVSLDEDTTGYNPDEVVTIGTLSVGEVEEDGFVVSLYRLKAESVE